MAERDLTGPHDPRADDRADDSTVDHEREILTWELFGRATRDLAAEIASDGFRPDVVLAVVLPPTAVLYHKPWSIIVPEYVWSHTDRWINFPWSSQDPVVSADNRDA